MATNGVLPYFEKGKVVPGFGRGSNRLGIPTGEVNAARGVFQDSTSRYCFILVED